MKPVEFLQQNMVLAKDQPQYLPLPVKREPDGTTTSCWQMTWRERLRALWTGRVYVSILTFGGRLQPQIVSLDPPAQGTTKP